MNNNNITFSYPNGEKAPDNHFSRVVFLKVLVIKLIFTVISGSPTSSTIGFENAGLRGLTALEGLIYNFGLIDNNANFSITSNATGSDQGYYAAGIGLPSGGVRDTSFVDLQRLGSNKDWITVPLSRDRYNVLCWSS